MPAAAHPATIGLAPPLPDRAARAHDILTPERVSARRDLRIPSIDPIPEEPRP